MSTPIHKLFLCLLLWLISANSAGAAENDQESQTLFFPFESCLSFTVKSVQEHPDSEAPGNRRFKITVLVDDILRDYHGAFEIGTEADFIITNPHPSILPQSSPESIVGTHCLWSFNKSFLNWQPDCVHKPIGDNPSPAQLATLKSKVQDGILHPYCVLLMVDSVERDKQDKFRVIVHGKVERVLLTETGEHIAAGVRFSKDDRPILGPISVNSEIKPGKERYWYCAVPPKQIDAYMNLKGKSAVLYTDSTGEAVGAFPYQSFADEDLDQLQAKLARREGQLFDLNAQALELMRKTWTFERLRDYCRPESRHVPPPWHFQCKSYDGHNYEHKLYDVTPADLGEVRYSIISIGTQPLSCSIMVRKGNDFWFPAGACFAGLPRNDDEFTKHRIRDSIEQIEWSSRWANSSSAILFETRFSSAFRKAAEVLQGAVCPDSLTLLSPPADL